MDRPSTSTGVPAGGDQGASSSSRRRSSNSHNAADQPAEDSRPRSGSTFSSFSFSEAGRDFQEEIVDPGPATKARRISWRSALPLMFAVIPPAIGLVFKNGSSFLTDVILLGLAAIFLHWSVTAPWKWYLSAQEIREAHEIVLEEVMSGQNTPDEGAEGGSGASTPTADKQEIAQQVTSALRQLRIHQIVALAACFLAPVASTYLMSYIRNLLSRPSEGLVSKFNIGIFLLSAEISPTSHLIKLVLAHTQYLQRVVRMDPYKRLGVTRAQWNEVLDRLEELELRLGRTQSCECRHKNPKEVKQMQASLVREARAAVQPDIDALGRAMRRYEKQTRMLAIETEHRLRELGVRLDDAISLSSAIASRAGASPSLLNGVFYLVTLPPRVVFQLPVRLIRFGTSLLRGSHTRDTTASRSTASRPAAAAAASIGPPMASGALTGTATEGRATSSGRMLKRR